MRIALRIHLLILGFSTFLSAQVSIPMIYLGEIGYLDSDCGEEQRITMDLGIAKVYGSGKESVRLEGRNDSGRRWQLWVPRYRICSSLNGIDAWIADFDNNGRQDLLLSGHEAVNGACLDFVDLIIVLFTETGNPAAYFTETHGFSDLGEPPHAVMDLNRDGRTELVLSECWWQGGGHPEVRQVTGVFEARNEGWVALRHASEEPYLHELRTRMEMQWVAWSSDFDPDSVIWLAGEQAKWPDSLQLVGRTGLPRIELDE
jgi:hypothetical protein